MRGPLRRAQNWGSVFPAPRQRGGEPRLGAVGGARAATKFLPRQRCSKSEAPSTAQTRGPPPPLSRGRMHTTLLPRTHSARERCQTAMSNRVIASEAKQPSAAERFWIASSLRSSQ